MQAQSLQLRCITLSYCQNALFTTTTFFQKLTFSASFYNHSSLFLTGKELLNGGLLSSASNNEQMYGGEASRSVNGKLME